jgi:hypothetical protein
MGFVSWRYVSVSRGSGVRTARRRRACRTASTVLIMGLVVGLLVAVIQDGLGRGVMKIRKRLSKLNICN